MKIIFVIGGVVSGLGKGICAASIGSLFKKANKKVFMQKCDPYLNIDPGTISPLQHGEVYVTADGGETDLDLGHYERFVDENFSKLSNITSGRIYQEVLRQERNGDYIGQTIQVIPHVTNLIKKSIYDAGKLSNCDVLIVEIGGTAGDIESLPFLEAIRQIRMEKGTENVMFILVGLLPYISASKEHKTKPIQHSVKELLSIGIQPDIIITRSSFQTPPDVLAKIALFCNVNNNNVIQSYDVESIYQVPKVFYDQNIHGIIAKQFKWNAIKPKMQEVDLFLNKISHSIQTDIKIYIVGKYVAMSDAYLSVIESINIAGFENHVKPQIVWIKSDELNEQNYVEKLQGANGIIIPGGFGSRGIEGMILTARYARENNVPFLGICLGMQIAAIEYARNVLGIKKANSAEFDKNGVSIFIILEGKSSSQNLGGTLRLGNYKTTVTKNSLLEKLYNKPSFVERHRHRYEFNNQYRKQFEKSGIIFSGEYVDKSLVEVMELPKNKFFIGSQFHPEFTSRPNKPNPLFYGLIKAVISKEK